MKWQKETGRRCTGLLTAMGWLAGCLFVTPVLAECDQLPADPHVGNAGCLLAQNGQVLMVQQRLNGRWALPGGTVEPGERAACTAARETLEETGLTVQVQQHLLTLDNGFHIFRCQAVAGQTLEPRDVLEIQAVAWQSERQRAEIPWRFSAQRERIEALMRQEAGAASAPSRP